MRALPERLGTWPHPKLQVGRSDGLRQQGHASECKALAHPAACTHMLPTVPRLSITQLHQEMPQRDLVLGAPAASPQSPVSATGGSLRVTGAQADDTDGALWVTLQGAGCLVGQWLPRIGHQDGAAVPGKLGLIGKRTCKQMESGTAAGVVVPTTSKLAFSIGWYCRAQLLLGMLINPTRWTVRPHLHPAQTLRSARAPAGKTGCCRSSWQPQAAAPSGSGCRL